MATSRRDERVGVLLPEEHEQLRREADAAVRLEGEMARRLARHGVRGVDEMVEMHDRLRRAADAIALPEIDFALARIAGLSDRLRLLRSRLDRLAAARRALGVGQASGREVPAAATDAALAPGTGDPGARNGRGHRGPGSP